MNILLIGSGGREHALAVKISQSPHCQKLYIAPGNAGTSSYGTNLTISPVDFEAIIDSCVRHEIGMVVVGPEEPLVKGIVERFKSDSRVAEVQVIGPSMEGARLEGSKDYAKSFMERHRIPTAAYGSFTADSLEKGKGFLDTLQPPFVLKADGLAAGKGVLIIDDRTQAKNDLQEMLQGDRFGAAGNTVVIEEFLRGIELSVFVFTDGDSYVILPEAKDYKRIGDGDKGPNTGGMGAVSPVPFAGTEFMRKVEEKIVKPTIDGLKQEKIPYVGWIFIGLMNVDGDPFVIEYNVRMGDPETEVVIPRIKSDLVELFQCATTRRLAEYELEIDPRTALTVMLVSGGYPDGYVKGKVIRGLESVTGSFAYQAGTMQATDGSIITSGGRVLTVTSLADDIVQARNKSYDAINGIYFDGMFYRKDIGEDLLKYQ
ncbi:MAG: phosphoribosylamine--glycine ligase [Bacteroidota bacterium]